MTDEHASSGPRLSRRTLLRTTGAAVGGAAFAGVGRAAHGNDEYDNYEYHGHAPVPGAEELVVQGNWAYVASAGLTTVDLRDPTTPRRPPTTST